MYICVGVAINILKNSRRNKTTISQTFFQKLNTLLWSTYGTYVLHYWYLFLIVYYNIYKCIHIFMGLFISSYNFKGIYMSLYIYMYIFICFNTISVSQKKNKWQLLFLPLLSWTWLQPRQKQRQRHGTPNLFDFVKSLYMPYSSIRWEFLWYLIFV